MAVIEKSYKHAVESLRRDFGAKLSSKRLRVEDILALGTELEIRRELSRNGVEEDHHQKFLATFRLRGDDDLQKMATVSGKINVQLPLMVRTLTEILQELSQTNIAVSSPHMRKKKKMERHIQNLLDGCRILRRESHGA